MHDAHIQNIDGNATCVKRSDRRTDGAPLHHPKEHPTTFARRVLRRLREGGGGFRRQAAANTHPRNEILTFYGYP